MGQYEQLLRRNADRINYATVRSTILGDSLENSLASAETGLDREITTPLIHSPILLAHLYPGIPIEEAQARFSLAVRQDNQILFVIKCASIPGYDTNATRELLGNPEREGHLITIKVGSQHKQCRHKGSCSCNSEVYYAVSLVRDQPERMQDGSYLLRRMKQSKILVEMVGNSTASYIETVDVLVDKFILEPTFANYKELVDKTRIPPPPRLMDLRRSRDPRA